VSVKMSTVSDGKVVAVDLDNVICRSDPKIREIIGRISGISLSQEEITDYAYSRALLHRGIELSAARRAVEEALCMFHDSECLNVEPVHGALGGINTLQVHGFSVVIATSRPTFCIKNTQLWLRDHGVPFKELLFLENKAEAAQKWTFLIDDALHHAEAVCESGIPVCLLDYPWNRKTSACPFMYRANDWDGIVSIVFREFGRA
jgi:uncharacterized protein